MYSVRIDDSEEYVEESMLAAQNAMQEHWFIVEIEHYRDGEYNAAHGICKNQKTDEEFWFTIQLEMTKDKN